MCNKKIDVISAQVTALFQYIRCGEIWNMQQIKLRVTCIRHNIQFAKQKVIYKLLTAAAASKMLITLHCCT